MYSTTSPRRRALRALFKGLLALAIFVVSLLAIEGASSVILLARELEESGVTLAEHKHTTYDPLLGWVNWMVVAGCVAGIIFGALSKKKEIGRRVAAAGL